MNFYSILICVNVNYYLILINGFKIQKIKEFKRKKEV